MSVPAKRSYMRAAARRAHILECAREVFARTGFHVSSVADICSAAGIGRGTLYQYFGNKREVFVAVVEQLVERIAKVLATRPPIASIAGASEAPLEMIVAFCEQRIAAQLEAVFADENSLRLLLREARGMDGHVDALLQRVDDVMLGAMAEELKAAVEIGVIRCDEPELTAQFILGGVEKMVLMALSRDEAIDRKRILQVVVELQLFGLLSPHVRTRSTTSTP